jgi:hypothetical protein
MKFPSSVLSYAEYLNAVHILGEAERPFLAIRGADAETESVKVCIVINRCETADQIGILE